MRKYMTLPDLAEELGVQIVTVSAWVKKYGMPVTRVGKKIFVKDTDFDHWMRRHTLGVMPAAEPQVDKLMREVAAFEARV